MSREKIINILEYCASDAPCQNCINYDVNSNSCNMSPIIKEVAPILANRTKDYIAWANESKTHVCATCHRKNDNCPIAQHYALPEDGHCHLWQ